MISPRYSIRTLILLVTAICLYLAGWELTRHYAVMKSGEILAEIEAVQGPIPASISPPYEISPAPLVVQRTEFGDFHSTRRYYLWFFGLRIELP